LCTQAIKINWKDADKALTKLYPRETTHDEEDDEEDAVDAGSFFNFFEQESDPFEVSRSIAEVIDQMS
jgi:template-activating factor I